MLVDEHSLPVDAGGHLVTLDLKRMNDGVWCPSVVSVPWESLFPQKRDVFVCPCMVVSLQPRQNIKVLN